MMKNFFSLLSLALLLAIFQANAFCPGPASSRSGLATYTTTNTELNFFGAPKDDGSPGDYVCKDCGYVFTKGPKAWAALPDDYSCPPCGAPKRRFKKVPKGSASGTVNVKKDWFGN